MIRSTCAMLLWLFPLLSAAQNDTRSRIARVEKGLLPRVVLETELDPQMKLSDRMAHYAVPGLSVVVIDGGKVAWVRHYGFADLSLGRKVNAQTRFQAGELSTVLTSLGALELIEQRKLAFDEDIHRWLRSWKVPESPALGDGKVTVRRLLSHAAGFGIPYYDGYEASGDLPTLVQVLEGEAPAVSRRHHVESTPGVRTRFSAGGYSVLQQVMMDATKERFAPLMTRLLLRPLKLTGSTFDQPPPSSLGAKLATGYQNEGPVGGGWRIYPEQAAFGLWATAEDLAKVVLEIQQARQGKGKVLSRASAEALLTPVFGGMGLGVRIAGEGAAMRFSQLGQTAGFDAVMVGYVSSGKGAVVLTNREGGLALADELLLAIAAEYMWPGYEPLKAVDVPAEVLDGLAGSYVLAPLEVSGRTLPETTATAFVKGTQLYWQPKGMEPRPLWASGKDAFFALDNAPGVRFQRDPRGKVTGVVVHGNGVERRGRRVEARPQP